MSHPDLYQAVVFAGIPAVNNALYHRLRFSVGDPAALIQFVDSSHRLLILRDIEMARAKEKALVDEVACPADFSPEHGLSGDRETATAQAVAECLVRKGVQHVTADRTLPFIFADEMKHRGIEVHCDRELGVLDRRRKDDEEVGWLQKAQSVTEGAVEMACGMIAGATANTSGILMHDGAVLTSERVRTAVDIWLLERGFGSISWIIAGGKDGADCHNPGRGPLRTGEPVIVDIFPEDRSTRYHGDCTRTVVHGAIPPEIGKMHSAVVAAKAAAMQRCRAGATGEMVHDATTRVILEHGYEMGLPDESSPDDFCSMPHGTGHGIGLDVHEPPLLDQGGPELFSGDAITVEPGLYSLALGGIRVEDMVIVREDGCENLNRLHEGLDWS